MSAVTVGGAAAPRPVSVSPGVRRFWLVAGSVVAVALLLGGALQVLLAVAHETRTEVRTFPVNGVRLLDVHVDSGSVRVVAGDDDRIHVTGRINHGLQSTEHSVRRIGNRLVIDASCPALSSFCSTDWVVRAPADLPTSVDTKGDIHVVGSHSTLHLYSDHGSISGDSIESGRVHVSTNHGDLSMTFAASPQLVVASANHGDIELTIPRRNATYRVDASSDHGTTDAQVRTDPASSRTIRAHSDHGDVSIRYFTP